MTNMLVLPVQEEPGDPVRAEVQQPPRYSDQERIRRRPGGEWHLLPGVHRPAAAGGRPQVRHRRLHGHDVTGPAARLRLLGRRPAQVGVLLFSVITFLFFWSVFIEVTVTVCAILGK